MGTTTKQRVRGDVIAYAVGICQASVCAPADLAENEVADAVNWQHPTGLDHGWQIDEAPTFRSGEPNPCACNVDAERRHWLLCC